MGAAEAEGNKINPDMVWPGIRVLLNKFNSFSAAVKSRFLVLVINTNIK